MKKHLLLFVCLAMIVSSLFVIGGTKNNIAYADDIKNTITVYGEYEIQAEPDCAIINFGVQTNGVDLQTTQQSNSDSMSKVLVVLKQAKIDDKDISTKSYTINQRFDYDKSYSSQGFEVRNMLEVSTQDIDSLPTLITDLTKAGANKFVSICFGLKNSNEQYSQALQGAYKNAQDKLSILGKSDANIVEIEEQRAYNCYTSYSYLSSLKSLDNMTPIKEGKIKINGK